MNNEYSNFVSSMVKVRGALTFYRELPRNGAFCENGRKFYWIGNSPEGCCIFSLIVDQNDSKPQIVLLEKNLMDWIKPGTKLSKEEELLRERTRSVAVGITQFTVHDASNQILIPVNNLNNRNIDPDFYFFPLSFSVLWKYLSYETRRWIELIATIGFKRCRAGDGCQIFT